MTPELQEAVAKIARHCWRGAHWEKRPDGPRMVREPLKKSHLERHVNNGPSVGLAPITPGESTTRVAVLDFDSHKGEVKWADMAGVAMSVQHKLMEAGLQPIPFRSSGGKGIHLICLWEAPQDAYSVRECLAGALSAAGLKNGTKGVKHAEVEIFPKQDSVELDGFGNMFILPLTGESLPLDPVTLNLKGYEYAEDIGEWLKSKPVPVLTKPVDSAQKVRQIDAASLSTSLAEIRSALAAIPNEAAGSLDYDAWRNVMFALHNATGGSAEGLSLAHEFSARSPKYDADFLDERVWPYIRDERGGALITVQTLYNRARQFGWQDDVLSDFEVLEGEQQSQDEAVGQVSGSAKAPGQPSAASTTPGRFRFIPDDEFTTRPPPRWIVKNLIPEAELVAIFGPTGSGKSFLTLDVGASVQRGVPWRDLKVQQGQVAYIAAEGAGGFRNRLVAYQQHNELARLGLHVLPAAPNLLKIDDAKELIAAVRAIGKVRLVIVDTLAQTTPGADENSADDMGRLVASCKALHRATGATVVLIHHAGKDPGRGMRGSSAMQAACDAVIEVSREGEQRFATVAKMKDGIDGAVYPFRLDIVAIGEDEDGGVIDSCVVKHQDKAEEAASTRQPAGDVAKALWQSINDLAMLGGDETTVAAVIEDAIKAMVTDPSKRDRRREVATRALQGLASAGWVGIEDGRVLIRGRANVSTH